MSCWYYSSDELEHRTPSREDGVPLCVENRYRRDGARFIINASNTLGLRYETPATGVVFFHRFFMIQSFKQFNRWVVAAACLLLAGKVEETPKKCKDVLKVTQSILTEQQMANFGSNPKEELLTHERILLQTIKFDLQVEHPYAHLLRIAKSFKGEKQKTEKLVQTAWTFVNDSLSTVLCLQWEPQAIAVAFLYLAGKLSKYDLQASTQSKSRNWWRQFVDTLDVHDLDTICHQVLDTYSEAADSSSASQDEDDEPQAPTPHQTPPSTASIPPSLSVTQSGGVGHTTSTHVPLPMAQSQLLTQQLLTQQLPHPSSQQQQQQQQQQLVTPPLPLNSLQAIVGAAPGAGGGGSGLAIRTPPTTNISTLTNYQGFQQNLLSSRVGIPPTPPPQQQQQQQQPSPAIATPTHPTGFSMLSAGTLGSTSLAVQQLAQANLLQQQQQVLRAVQQTIRLAGGPETTPPPAKRHAMESPYRPGLPQPHQHQLLSSYTSPASAQQQQQQQQAAAAAAAAAGFPQQLATPPALPTASHMFPSPGLTPRSLPPLPSALPLPVSSAQLRPVVPTLPGAASFRSPGEVRRTMSWQPK